MIIKEMDARQNSKWKYTGLWIQNSVLEGL